MELAVVTPLLFLLLAGAADYGRAFFVSITIANAARAGAEYGSQNTATSVDSTGIKSFTLADGQDAAPFTVGVTHYCKCAGSAHACSLCADNSVPEVFVEVTATKKLGTFVKYPGFKDTVTISRKATFRGQ